MGPSSRTMEMTRILPISSPAQISDSLQPLDLYISLSKGILFGLVVSLFTCYHGLRARRAPFEVPMVARSGVIQAMFFVFVSSAVLSAGFYWI